MMKNLLTVVNCFITLLLFRWGLMNNPNEPKLMIFAALLMFILLQLSLYIPAIFKYLNEES